MFKVIINNYIQPTTTIKQVRFPKSKKVRIRKKWAKRTCNFKTFYSDTAVVIGDTVFVNQSQCDKLISSFDSHSFKPIVKY